MTRRHLLAIVTAGALGAGLGACADDPTYMIVTVTSRAAVHDATNLKVTLTNGGTSRTDDLTIGSKPFPLTFSISAPGRAGDLDIQIDAVDQMGNIVGRGSSTSMVAAPMASVMLETADFVINTEYAEDQYPSDDYEAHGFQVAAAADGTWTAAYRDKCTAPCNMYARRFDKTGRPVSTKLAAGTNGFPISTSLTTFPSTPAIANAGMTTAVVWDADDGAATNPVVGIACRSMDQTGQGIPNQTLIADASPDVVSIAPLSNGNFAVAWNSARTSIRAAILKPDCSVLAGATNASTTANATRGAVASTTGTQGTVLYAFLVDGGVRVRLANNTNTYTSPTDIQFLPKTATEEIESVRVAPLGTGFAVLVRWALSSGADGPGRIELYRTNAMGAVIGSAILVTNKSGSDFQSSEAFGVATRADGVMMVVWHSCLTNGDGSGCGVFGRAFRTDGTPVADEFTIPTTTTGDQTNPSVAALDDAFVVVWKDDSGTPPDIAGSAVRGRIIYPN